MPKKGEYYSPSGITNAGSFRIIGIAEKEQFKYFSPEIIVLPSSITESQYKTMVGELFMIHEDLVMNHNSSVGFKGSNIYRLEKIESLISSIRKPMLRIKAALDKYYEKLGILMSLKGKKQMGKERLSKIDSDVQRWDFCSRQLEELCNLNFIKSCTPVKGGWKPTQVFLKDSNYNMVWKNLKGMKRDMIVFDDIGMKSISVKDTCDIYEYWCLYKMLHLLIEVQGWRLTRKDTLIRAFRDFMESGDMQQIEGFSAELSHRLNDYKFGRDNAELFLKVEFNTTFKDKEGKDKRPDYKFTFTDFNNNKSIVYMDAKYKNYVEQGIQELVKDIKKVAIDKYLKGFEGTDNEAAASFIIHTDDKNSWFVRYGGFYKENTLRNFKMISTIRNLDGSERAFVEVADHRYGSILLIPGKTKAFLTLTKMILEYKLKNFWTCWNCGEHRPDYISIEKKLTVGGFNKYHCTCSSCSEFWVKTHCSNKGHDIIKHLDNYHDSISEKAWFVECPKGCDTWITKKGYGIKDEFGYRMD